MAGQGFSQLEFSDRNTIVYIEFSADRVHIGQDIYPALPWETQAVHDLMIAYFPTASCTHVCH